MRNVTPFPAKTPGSLQGVVVLNCPLDLLFDPGPLKRLFALKDWHIAEEAVCRMLEDMAFRLDQLQRGLAALDFVHMQQPARRIAFVAKELGLLEVATAANHLRQCLKQADGVALEAVMARLERGFDAAVSEIWTFRDL